MIDFSWNLEILFFVIAVVWTSVGFAIYFFLARNTTLSLKIWRWNPDLDSQAKEILMQRMWGFLFMGAGPLLFILFWPGKKLAEYGFGFSFLSPPPWWILAVIAFIIIAGYFAAKKPANLAMYPQIRCKKWTPALLGISGTTWLTFLLGYEFLFRGFLLFASLEIMAPWAAIALNCAIYAFAHLYKGPGETFGTLPFGVLFCYLTLITGNIWTALLIHSIMALSNEWWSIHRHTNMEFIRGRKL
jgi:membrane protease YdiL (CAAX protease family)